MTPKAGARRRSKPPLPQLPPPGQLVFNVREVRALLGLSRKKVMLLIEDKALTARKIGSTWAILPASVLALLPEEPKPAR